MLKFIAKGIIRGNMTILLKFLKENDNEAEAYLEKQPPEVFYEKRCS